VRAGSFERLRVSDFDAYLPEKWTSNVYTRERLEAKQCLLNLGRALVPVLEELGIEVQIYASDEHPSLWNQKKVDAQWVFFWRTEAQRKVLEAQVDLERTLAATLADPTPMTRHAFLCLRLDRDTLRVGLQIHHDAWVDCVNLKNKLSDPGSRREVGDLVARLPEPIVIGLSGRAATPAAELAADLVAEHVESLERTADAVMFIGLDVSRADAVAMGSDLVGYLVPRMAALAELYRFGAWSERNDHVSSDAEFLSRRAARGARREKLDAEEARWKTAHEERKRKEAAVREELEEVFRREAVSRASQPRRPRPQTTESAPSDAGEPPQHAPRREPEKREAPRRVPRPEPRKAEPRPEPRKSEQRPVAPPRPDVPIPLEPGHHARVTKGPLAGQIGVVQEVDPKGTARIMVGLLATRISLDDLFGLGKPRS